VHINVVWHPSSLDHDPGPDHPESPARVQAILEALRAPPLAERVCWHEARPASDAALLRVHTAPYLRLLADLAARGGGALDADTVMSGASLVAARHAAGAAMRAAELALDGEPAFALGRPPGHHAVADAAMGFCLINNVVGAARAAVEDRGASRVLIVDWDVHHGNGTQALVASEPRIRYVSLHQWPLYPGTGRAEERGAGNIFNVPRPPGLPRERYVADLDDAVRAATDGWRPDLVLISAGFDALAGDPLAGFTLEPEDYATWVTRWRRIGAPIASVLEGGYVPRRLQQAVAAHLLALGAA
jgi:acetoin utilization deacetylase AcuC-like enzyme